MVNKRIIGEKWNSEKSRYIVIARQVLRFIRVFTFYEFIRHTILINRKYLFIRHSSIFLLFEVCLVYCTYHKYKIFSNFVKLLTELYCCSKVFSPLRLIPIINLYCLYNKFIYQVSFFFTKTTIIRNIKPLDAMLHTGGGLLQGTTETYYVNICICTYLLKCISIYFTYLTLRCLRVTIFQVFLNTGYFHPRILKWN